MNGSIIFARWRQHASPFNTCFLGHTQVHKPNDISIRSAVSGHTQVHIPNDISIRSAVSAQHTADCPYTLQLAPFPQYCPFPWGVWTPSNTIPWALLSPQPKRYLDWFSRFCTHDRRVFLYFTKGRPFPPLKTAPSHGGI